MLPTMNRHITTVGTRFRLLICGMSLLQGDTLTKSIAKNILRQRIYSVALDYFCNDRTFPTQSCNTNLDDIQTLLKFWAMMHRDRQYIKSNLVTDHDQDRVGGPTSLQHNEVSNSFLPLRENILLVRENFLPLGENSLPLWENFLTMRENILLLRENFLPFRETFYHLRENILLLRENILLLRENFLPWGKLFYN